MSSAIRYRVVVGGVEVVFDGDFVAEARRQYRIFVIQSAGESVALFRNYDLIRQYHPPSLSVENDRIS